MLFRQFPEQFFIVGFHSEPIILIVLQKEVSDSKSSGSYWEIIFFVKFLQFLSYRLHHVNGPLAQFIVMEFPPWTATFGGDH